MRTLTIGLLALLAAPAAAVAQDGFAIGPRVTFVRGTTDSPDGTQRFTGGFLRLGGGRAGLEVAMDYRTGITGDLTERVKSYPIQASLLLYPVRARLAPYVLVGVGWYTQNVTRFSAPTGTVVVTDETARKMGYHAGFGGELRLHRRIGVFGDYRYTMVRFGETEEPSEPLAGWIPGAQRLKLSHQGSMFTWGAALYF